MPGEGRLTDRAGQDFAARDGYRPEIDGLRAIAVLAVMFFHAAVPGFTGGYVGVDVFFVISGYLITGIIVRQHAAGRFGLRAFYARRARRILPALLLVLTVSVPCAFAVLTPAALRSFGASLAASAASVPNLYFIRNTGYFATPIERLPLIHLWSLGVEEQFYLLYPLLLLLVLRLAPRGRAIALGAAALLSFLLCEWLSRSAPAASFYLLPSRAWELLVGAILVLIPAQRRLPPDAAALAGLVLIAAPLPLYDALTRFPGIAALPPVVGAALVLHHARAGTRAARALAFRPLVGIGLISYSLYLWHQPVLAFANAWLLAEPLATRLGLLAVSALAAWLSWRFVENPIRYRLAGQGRVLIAVASSVTALLIAAGILFVATRGYPARLPPHAVVIDRARAADSTALGRCLPASLVPAERACQRRTRGSRGPVTIAVFGDSHAKAIVPALDPYLRRTGQRAVLLLSAGCQPILVPVGTGRVRPHCRPFVEQSLRYLGERPEIRTVIVAGRWTAATAAKGFDNGEGGAEGHSPGATRRPVPSRVFREGLAATLAALHRSGKRVVLVYPIPEAGWDVPVQMFKLELHGTAGRAPLSTGHARFRERNARTIAMLDSYGQHDWLVRVRPEAGLCGRLVAGRCVVEWQGRALYLDRDHLNAIGARLALPALPAQLGPARPRP